MTKDEVKKLKMNSPESLQFLNNATKFYNLMMMYRCAIREIQTKLEVLDDEFSYMVNNSSSRKRYASPKAGTELYLDLVFRQ